MVWCRPHHLDLPRPSLEREPLQLTGASHHVLLSYQRWVFVLVPVLQSQPQWEHFLDHLVPTTTMEPHWSFPFQGGTRNRVDGHPMADEVADWGTVAFVVVVAVVVAPSFLTMFQGGTDEDVVVVTKDGLPKDLSCR